LSVNANGDGTFTSEDGQKNFSPSAQRLQAHYARRSLYRHLDDLRDLGFLSWKREQNHYGRRIYQITIPKKTGATKAKKTGATKAKNRCHETVEQVPQLRTPSVLPSNTDTPLPPSREGEQIFRWGFEDIAVLMGRKHRLPNLDSYHGAQAKYVVEFLHQRGFEARTVAKEQETPRPP
jgi:hypothetical protein